MTNLHQRARVTIIILATLTLGLGVVGWWALQQIERTASEVQTQTLINVSVTMSLAERAAQIAALGPYIGESPVPFQLQAERQELENRFALLSERVLSLSEVSVRNELELKIASLHDQLQQLTSVVEKDLFIREDIRAIQFELNEWLLQVLNHPSLDARANASLTIYTQFLQTDFSEPYQAMQQIDTVRQAALASIEGLVLAESTLSVLTELIESSSIKMEERAQLSTQKTLLFASIRAQSESLTGFVQNYVAKVQADISSQRERISAAVQSGRLGILLVTILALLSMLEGFWFMSRLTFDLKTVTDDMTQLARGEQRTRHLAIDRKDEIGDLARTFDVFSKSSADLVRVSRDLENQKRLLETVFNTINDGLSVFSKERKILAWNERYLELFELDSKAVYIGMPLEAVQELMSRQPHQNLSLDRQLVSMENINESRETEPHHFERHYDNGKVIEFRSQPMQNGGFVTLYTDQTDRRAIETQLQQAQKMEALGQLIGGVSHDFNNLLAALVGNLQLLHNSSVLAQQDRHYAERALGIAERGTQLVERLLAFARRQHLHPEVININELVEGMVDLIEYSVAPNIEVVLLLDASIPSAWIDPSQLENALLNLAINASAAMPNGGTLTIRTRVLRSNPLNRLEIQVQDTGVGMSTDVMARVWEPFYTTKAVGQGSGLGLSLVYGFVRQSGGDVLLESQLGKGTHVHLFLPIPNDIEINQEPYHRMSVKPLTIADDTILLLVEDDQSVLQPMRDTLTNLGLEVHAVATAESALQWISEHHARLGAVLTDVNLGGDISGVDLANQVEQDFPDVPVVLTSGLPREHLIQIFQMKDYHPFLPKPVRFEQLREVFRRGV